MRLVCYSCGKENEFLSTIGRRDVCEHCGVDIRCCRQCHHYDETHSDECMEPEAEPPQNKEQGNFCDYYRPSERVRGGRGDVDAAKAAFDALFGKKK